MKILAIDTSTHYLSMAVVKENKILAHRNIKLRKILSSSIILEIERILKKAKFSLSGLDGFAVGLGPGSFTSLRVGLSTIKAFSFALEKPVVGISSLDVLAMNVKEDGSICVLSDAKRNLLYAAFYEKKNGEIERKSDYLLVSLENLEERISTETILVGDGINILGQATEKIKGKLTSPSQWRPQAKNLALLALKRFERKEFDDVDKLVPLYLYPEDCQVVKRVGSR